MKEKGFTLLEMLAVIFLTSVIIFPLLTALIGNYEVNITMHKRKAASSMTITTMQAFEKFDYDELVSLLAENLEDYEASEYDEDGYYVRLTGDSCERLPDPEEVVDGEFNEFLLCEYIFDQEWNNFSFEPEIFQAYIYPYYITEDVRNNLLESSLPTRVKEHISTIATCTDCDPGDLSAVRISVWIRYGPTEASVVSHGLLSDITGVEVGGNDD